MVQAKQLRRVVVEVTPHCHHRCLHCYNHWPGRLPRAAGPGALSRRRIRTLLSRIREDAPIEQVAISGGEPMLRKDLGGIVRDLTADGLSVVVITNGTLVTRQRLRSFPAETLFETTLFGVSAALHDRIAGRQGAFAKTLDAIAEMRLRGCSVVVAIVISALNAHEVGRTIELAIALGADGVMLNRVNLSRRVYQDQQAIIPTQEHLRVAFGQAQEIAHRYRLRLPVSIPVPPCLLDLGTYPRLRFGFCPRGGKDSYYTISPAGLLRPCNHSSVVLGDLHHQRFAEIVASPLTRQFWKPVASDCKACDLPQGRKCRGGCLAAACECLGTGEAIDPILRFAAGCAGTPERQDQTVPF